MILKKEVLMTHEEVNDALNILTKVNDVNFNTLKVLEEMAETSEVLLKRITKQEQLKPSLDLVIEELGDLRVRSMILSRHLGIDEEINHRVNSKLALLYKAAKAGKLGTTVTINKTTNE